MLGLTDVERARMRDLADVIDGCDYIEVHQGLSALDYNGDDVRLIRAALVWAGADPVEMLRKLDPAPSSDFVHAPEDRAPPSAFQKLHVALDKVAAASPPRQPLADLRGDRDKARDALLLALSECIIGMLPRGGDARQAGKKLEAAMEAVRR